MFRNSVFTFFLVACVIVFVSCASLAQDADSPAPWRTISADVVYGHKSGMALTYDVIKPLDADMNGAGVLFMVSGGWNSRWTNPDNVVRKNPPKQKNMFEKLIERGYTVYLVRHGSAPKFKVPDAVADVRQAIRHIKFNAKKHGIDPTRIGVCGGSAGGHLSLMLGTTGKNGRDQPKNLRGMGTRVAAVVAYFPPTNLSSYVNDPDLVKRFPALDFDKSTVDAVSPIKHVSSDDAPTLLVHGDEDRLVPLSESANIKKAFDAENVANQLIVIEGAKHGFGGKDRQKAEQALVGWFDKYLAKQEDSP